MKLLFSAILACLTAGLTYAAPAPAGGFAVPGAAAAGADTTLQVKAPAGLWLQCVVYNPTNATAKANVFAWNSPTNAPGVLDPTVTGYILRYGDVTKAETNIVRLAHKGVAVHQFAWFSELSTNLTYYFHVTATNSAGEESLPSNVVIYKPER